jgi:predicted alpha/beta hydrolase family esterase
MQVGTNFTTHANYQIGPNAIDLRKPMVGVKSRNDKMYSASSANPSATQALIDHAY